MRVRVYVFKVYTDARPLSFIHSFVSCEYEATNRIQYTHKHIHTIAMNTYANICTHITHNTQSDKRILDKYTCHSVCASILVVGKLKLLNHTLPVIPHHLFPSLSYYFRFLFSIISDFSPFFLHKMCKIHMQLLHQFLSTHQ